MTERPDVLYVVGDRTPARHLVCSAEMLWWLPVLGPTAVVLTQTLVSNLDQERWETIELAKWVGLGGSRAHLWKSLERLQTFKVVTFFSTDVMSVRVELPALTERQLARLPEAMRDGYRESDPFNADRMDPIRPGCAGSGKSPHSFGRLETQSKESHDSS